MKKREQAYSTKFIKAIKDKKITFFTKETAGPIEVKMARGLRIYRKQFEKHQIAALTLSRQGTLAWKIPDAGWANPFDIMMYVHSPSWVLCVFDEKRYYLIDAVTFFVGNEISYTESDCQNLCSLHGQL